MEESEHNDIRATLPNNRLGAEGLEGQQRSLSMLHGGRQEGLEGAASWRRTELCWEAPPGGASGTLCAAVMVAQCTGSQGNRNIITRPQATEERRTGWDFIVDLQLTLTSKANHQSTGQTFLESRKSYWMYVSLSHTKVM